MDVVLHGRMQFWLVVVFIALELWADISGRWRFGIPYWELPLFLSAASVGFVGTFLLSGGSFHGTLTVTGIIIYVLGWGVRHAPYTHELIPGRNRAPVISWIWLQDTFRCRHVQAFGLAIEGLGLTLLSGNSQFSMIAGFAVLVVGALTIVIGDRFAYVASDRSSWDRRGDWLLFPHWRPVSLMGGIAALGAIFGSILTRERVIFYGTSDAAATTLGTLAQVVGTVGVLAISIGFVVAQVASSEVSLRSSTALGRDSLFISCVVAIPMSVAAELFLLARVGDLPDSPSNAWQVDLGYVVAVLCLTLISVFIWRAPTLLAPEIMIYVELKRFDARWGKRLRATWGQPNRQMPYIPGERLPVVFVKDDPLIAIERLLFGSIERRDNPTLRGALDQIADRIDSLFAREPDRNRPDENGVFHHWEEPARTDGLALDMYFFDRLRDLIDRAAELKNPIALQALVQFSLRVGPFDPARVQPLWKDLDLFSSDGPPAPGESLIRHIVRKSIENGLPEPAAQGLYEVARSMRRFAAILPSGEETLILRQVEDERIRGREAVWREMSQADPMPAAERQRRSDNDELVRLYQTQYIDYLATLSSEASHQKLWRVTWLASAEIAESASALFHANVSHSIRSPVLARSLWRLSDASDNIAKEFAQSGAEDDTLRFSMGDLTDTVKLLSAPGDQDLADEIAKAVVSVLKIQYARTALSWSAVHDAGRVGAELAEGFASSQALIIEALAEIGQDLRSQGWTSLQQQRRGLFGGVAAALRAQMGYGKLPREIAEPIGKKITKLLTSLHEPIWPSASYSLPIELAPEQQSKARSIRHSEKRKRRDESNLTRGNSSARASIDQRQPPNSEREVMPDPIEHPS